MIIYVNKIIEIICIIRRLFDSFTVIMQLTHQIIMLYYLFIFYNFDDKVARPI